MSTYKTKFDQATAEQFLQEHSYVPELELTMVADGETSQAFLFNAEDGPRVLRVNAHSKDGFLKDQVAHDRITVPGLTIPKILEVGEIEDGLYFAISERAPGKPLDKFSKEEIARLMPKIIATLEAIHSTKPLGGGYGNWDLSGDGDCQTWRESLTKSTQKDDDETRSAEFYDETYHDKLRAKILPLIDGCPEVRKLIHGDFGFNNALSNGVEITGVIDWEHAAYGDPIKDIAWLDFWDERQGYAEAFRIHYKNKGRLPEDFTQRLTCYKLLTGLSSLGFFARSRQAESYEYVRGIVDRIVS